MKHNTIKKVLSLLLVICMIASFAGCVPGEEDPTEPSTIETTSPTENTPAPTDGTTAPTDNTDATTSPTEETQAPTEPTEAETNPPATEAPNTDPTFATELPTESPVETFVDVVETVYAVSAVNVRTEPNTDSLIVGSLSYGESVQRTGIGNKGWSRVAYNGEEAYVYASYLSTTNPAQDTSGYPKSYSDSTCDITITKEWYEDAWCFIAHLHFTDYSRFGTSCANGEYDNGYETTSHAASRLDAIFAVNGCYSAPYLNYTVVRSGELCDGSGKNLWCPAVYSNQNGLLQSAWETGGTEGIAGVNIDSLVESGLVTDTFCFGPPILVNGSVTAGSDGSRAQRTFIGTNGNPGDIWIVVSEGRNADGESAGLTYSQCARLLGEKGCIFGVPLDGGGSSTMVFQGKVLNSAKAGQRSVVQGSGWRNHERSGAGAEAKHACPHSGIGGESVSYFEKLYRNDELPHRAKLVYIYLYDRRDVVGKAWPSVKRIAKDLSISEKTVRRAIQDLEKAGLVRKEYAYRKNGSHTSNRYYLL